MLSLKMKQQIPWLMAGARALLGPVLIVGQACGWNGFTLAAMVLAALLSDLFDGILARRWHCDTPAVRLFDSMADTVFYISVAAALFIGQHRLWRAHEALLGALLALEAVRFAVDLLKFGKPSSYHSYLAKTWGLLLATAVICTFAIGAASPRACEALLAAAFGLGIACDLEGLAMSAILPAWRNDVKTIAAAWRLRRKLTCAASCVLASS